MNTYIYETKNFIVEAVAKPHISREEGGHLKIKPKQYYENRWDLPIEEAKEVMLLSMLMGEAMKLAMNKR
jgi:diadenosine tetraphosphate (Ap4A) HIT family hydrolase